MSSKTPRFDAALEAVYQRIQPGERVCEESGEVFEQTQTDLDRYREHGVPPSVLSFPSNVRHLRAFLAGFDLFRRPLADGSEGVSMYDPECPLSLLPQKKWYEERLNGAFLKEEQVYDGERPFFDQWKQFSKTIPRPAIVHDPKNENSEWATYSVDAKDCYCTFGGAHIENIFYCDQGVGGKHSSDLSLCDNVEWSFDNALCQSSSNIFWCERSRDCVNVFFSLGCINCQDCFGCANLKGKKYCFLNKQLTEEEYQARIKEIDLTDALVVSQWKKKIHKEIWEKAPRRGADQVHTENAIGDDHHDSRDVSGVSMYGSERVYRSFAALNSKDCFDISSALENERCFNSTYTLFGYQNKMSVSCSRCIDVEYSELLEGCEHCFASIGLVNKKYCIFNKQYSEEEYWTRVDEIKTKMLERGEYGRFFPYDASAYAYNVSHASTIYDLSREQVEKLGGRWYEFPDLKTPAASIDELPLRLAETTYEVLKVTYRCPETGRAFRFVKPELELHRTLKVALPRIHPTKRRKDRMEDILPVRLYKRSCTECGLLMETRIPADHPSPILCDLCFEKRLLEGTTSLV